ncbi:MAG: DUF6151 family protein [Pseudomonadota bacterium]
MVALSCKCGKVRGTVDDAALKDMNRVICHCTGCQSFARFLSRPDILDHAGGSDIVQFAPAAVTITQGEDRIAGVRMTKSGPYRFYATCCNTPLGNSVSPALPVIGIVASTLDTKGQSKDEVFGPPDGITNIEHATADVPGGAKGLPAGLIMRFLGRIAKWRFTGRGWPHPFFDKATGKPRYPIAVVSEDQREGLRATG